MKLINIKLSLGDKMYLLLPSITHIIIFLIFLVIGVSLIISNIELLLDFSFENIKNNGVNIMGVIFTLVGSMSIYIFFSQYKQIQEIAFILNNGSLVNAKQIESKCVQKQENSDEYELFYEYVVYESLFKISTNTLYKEDYNINEQIIYAVSQPQKAILLTNLPSYIQEKVKGNFSI